MWGSKQKEFCMLNLRNIDFNLYTIINSTDEKVTFSSGKHGRNYMSKQLFAYLANCAGLTVIEQREIDWAGEEKLDCITLVSSY